MYIELAKVSKIIYTQNSFMLSPEHIKSKICIFTRQHYLENTFFSSYLNQETKHHVKIIDIDVHTNLVNLTGSILGYSGDYVEFCKTPNKQVFLTYY